MENVPQAPLPGVANIVWVSHHLVFLFCVCGSCRRLGRRRCPSYKKFTPPPTRDHENYVSRLLPRCAVLGHVLQRRLRCTYVE